MLRLKTRSQFQAVLAGIKLAGTPHFVVHYLSPDRWISDSVTSTVESGVRRAVFSHPDLWLGPLIPKRWAKRAVTRNAIKRQIFNVACDFESTLPLGAYVVRLRAEFSKKQFPSASSDSLKHTLRAELAQLLSTASRAGGTTSQPRRAK